MNCVAVLLIYRYEVNGYDMCSMKVYYSTTFRSDEDLIISNRMILFLEDLGHEVFGKELSRAFLKEGSLSIDKRDLYINNCDFALIDGSKPSSLGVGYDLGKILEKGKPVIFIYRSDMNPELHCNIDNQRFVISEYSLSDLEEVLGWCLEGVKKCMHRRFTFFISPELDHFLDKIVSNDGVSRSEFIRSLIKDRMMVRNDS